MNGTSQSNVALQWVSRSQVETVTRQILESYVASPLQRSEAGLYVLQLRDCIAEEAFYVGEFTGARSSVRLADPAGNTFDGGAIIARDDAELAEWIAVCDAVLRHHLSHEEQVETLVHEGLERYRQEHRVRQSILDRTAVDFSLLEEAD